MTPRVEIGKEGQSMLWQPHLLTDVMQARRSDALTIEPVLNPAGDATARRLKVKSDDTQITWSWGGWKMVEVRAEHADIRGPARKCAPPQRASVRWAELPTCDAVELMFYDGGSEPAGAVKVGVPRTAALGKDVEFAQPSGGATVVRLLNRADGRGVYVERLKLGQRLEGRRSFRPLRAIPFENGNSAVVVPLRDFEGIIAVVRQQPRRRMLLGYAHYKKDRLPPITLPDMSRTLDAEEFESLRAWVEGSGGEQRRAAHDDLTPAEWLENWPEWGRSRLIRISEQARQVLGVTDEVALTLLRAFPSGLLRYLTLLQCGLSSPAPEQSIRQLNAGSFQASLGDLLPGLPAVLGALTAWEEKDWAVGRAKSPCLADAVAWAGGQGVAALSRALHLLERRAAAVAAWESRQATFTHAAP